MDSLCVLTSTRALKRLRSNKLQTEERTLSVTITADTRFSCTFSFHFFGFWSFSLIRKHTLSCTTSWRNGAVRIFFSVNVFMSYTMTTNSLLMCLNAFFALKSFSILRRRFKLKASSKPSSNLRNAEYHISTHCFNCQYFNIGLNLRISV